MASKYGVNFTNIFQTVPSVKVDASGGTALSGCATTPTS